MEDEWRGGEREKGEPNSEDHGRGIT